MSLGLLLRVLQHCSQRAGHAVFLSRGSSEDDATFKLILLFWQNSLACGYSTEVLTEYWLEATFSF